MENNEIKIPNFMEESNRKVKERYVDARANSIGSDKVVVRKKKKKTVGRKWIIAAILATISVSSIALGVYLKSLHDKLPDVQVENFREDVEKILSDKEMDDSKAINEYEFSENAIFMKQKELEQQIADLEAELDILYAKADNKLMDSAIEANAGIDEIAMSLASNVNEVFDSYIDRAISGCQVPNNPTAFNQADDWFYDFTKFDMISFISNSLNSYNSVCDVMDLYNSLTEEEKASIVVSLGYDKVREFQMTDGTTTNNKDKFLFCMAYGYNRNNAEEVVKKAREDANNVYLKLANALIGYEYGVDNLDVSTSRIKRGGM